MSSCRTGGGSGSSAIPANARKTVQSLKEVVPNGEDEIYAVLKECNMDPDETVQRLLNQDPFHEVKRRRDKKKEGWNREGIDSRVRPASGAVQGKAGKTTFLDRGFGRGGSSSRHASNGFSAGRVRSLTPRENGNACTNMRAASTGGGTLSTVPPCGEGKTYLSGLSSQSLPASTVVTSPALQNGSQGYLRLTSVPQGSWGVSASGHATMADIVKANGTLISPPTVILSTIPAGPPVAASFSQRHTMSSMSIVLPVSTGVYSSSTDPVLHPLLDARGAGSGAIKRDIGTVGNQRMKADWSTPSLTMDAISTSSIASQSLQTSHSSTSPPVAVASLERDSHSTRLSSPPVSVSPRVPNDLPVSHSTSVADAGSSVGSQARHGAGTPSGGAPGSRTTVCGPFSRGPLYLSQHPVGTQKAGGSGLEWKPKLVVQSAGGIGSVNTSSPSETLRPVSPSLVSADSEILSIASSKLNSVDDQPVIIPNHLQVAESEQSHLSFGSFAAGFGASFTASFVSEGMNKITISTPEITPAIEAPSEQTLTSSAVSAALEVPSQNSVLQPISSPEDTLTSSGDTAINSLLPPAALQADLPRPDPIVHQGLHYPYVANYPPFNVMQHVPAGQYTYDATETQPPDVARLPSLMQPYADPAASYYTPTFRPGSDGDIRYPSFVSSNTPKYSGNIGMVNMMGQSLPSQEGGNSVLPPVPAAQTTQTGSSQTIPTMQQQPLPLHAYAGQAAGSPIGHFTNVFGYQYLPPSYTYMHTPPYQHNYATGGIYSQPPTGSNYPAAAASTYPPGVTTTVKYQLSQYKPGSTAGIAAHSAAAAGYGGYTPTPGYTVNPAVTGGSTSGYDDVVIPQYKDNLYIPSQQVEGSTVWIQAQLSRDMGGGVQAGSFYNLPGQGPHTTYAHAQQSTHTHTHPGAYAGLYHPSQSGQNQTTHQLLQQPQALAAALGGSQTGTYQHPQRNQQAWTSNY